MKRLSIVNLLAVAAIVIFLSSCSSRQSAQDRSSNKAGKALSCIVVLPVSTPVNSDGKMTFAQAKNLAGGAEYMDSLIVELLGGNSQVRIVNAQQMDGLLEDSSGNRLQQYQAIGKTLNCNAVLWSEIIRFKERVGGELSIDTPASAAFDMQLIGVDNGRVLWAASFSETQEALMSNLLSFSSAKSRGFTWVSVRELVEQGLKERLSDCKYLQESK